MNTSKSLNLQTVRNLRDLGGMTTKDGSRIKQGRLYRSGLLTNVAQEDLLVLNSLNIKKIYDFRSYKEREEHPDDILDGCENIHLPIFEERRNNTNQDEDDIHKIKNNAEELFSFQKVAFHYMELSYQNFVISDFSLSNYRLFFEDAYNTLKESPDKAILWHCMAGKDRTGFAAAMIEEILGVDRDSIYEDYMYSNEFLPKDNPIANMLMESYHGVNQEEDKKIVESVAITFMKVFKEYLDSAYKCIDEQYGGVENFLEKGLLVSKEKQLVWKEMLLEK